MVQQLNLSSMPTKKEDLISFFAQDRVLYSTAGTSVFIASIFGGSMDWIAIDSWGELSILVSISIAVLNFIFSIYERFLRKKNKKTRLCRRI